MRGGCGEERGNVGDGRKSEEKKEVKGGKWQVKEGSLSLDHTSTLSSLL